MVVKVSTAIRGTGHVMAGHIGCDASAEGVDGRQLLPMSAMRGQRLACPSVDLGQCGSAAASGRRTWLDRESWGLRDLDCEREPHEALQQRSERGAVGEQEH